MSQLGRISGPLLKDNLLRNGVNLTFSNFAGDPYLLKLDVDNRRIGIKDSNTGATDLQVDTDVKTVNLISQTSATIDNIRFTSNTVSTLTGSSLELIISPEQSDPLVLIDQMQSGDLDLKDNVIKNYQPNGDIRFSPTGQTRIFSNTQTTNDLNISGTINVSGTLTKNGNIVIGDNINEDTVDFNTDFSQDLLPGITGTYDLSSSSRRWRNAYVLNDTQITNLTQESITVSDQIQINWYATGATNEIYSLQSNDNVIISPDTGNTYVEDILINGNIINNTISNSVFSLGSTGIGYVRFMGTSGTGLPAGTTTERPTNLETGMLRWNTTIGRIEIYDGSVWYPATGPGAAIGFTEMEDLQTIYALAVG
jgi:hypothetical protein